MIQFFHLLKWQFILLHKNNIITISFAVTFIYAVVLFLLRDIQGLDTVLVALILNDPSVIGYFFIALSIYTEMKHQVLAAIIVTPVNMHQLIITRVLSLSIIGTLCSLGLVISVNGLDFNWWAFIIGSFSICLLSCLLGIYMLTFAGEFLRFTIISIPVFLFFINIPLVHYLGVIDLGYAAYLFPLEGSLQLIDFAVSNAPIDFTYVLFSLLLFVPAFYWLAFYRFNNTVIHQ